jgi:hypothetical protein
MRFSIEFSKFERKGVEKVGFLSFFSFLKANKRGILEIIEEK